MIKDNKVYGNETKLLAEGIYKTFPYVVVSLGSHPCSYVYIPSGKAIDIDGINCHCGVTYNGRHLPRWNELMESPIKMEQKGFWIGWDYNHAGDFHYSDYFNWTEPRDYEKAWTSEELEKECFEAIDSIINPEWWKMELSDDDTIKVGDVVKNKNGMEHFLVINIKNDENYGPYLFLRRVSNLNKNTLDMECYASEVEKTYISENSYRIALEDYIEKRKELKELALKYGIYWQNGEGDYL